MIEPDAFDRRALRELIPQVLGALVRRYGDFARCEDATQDALLAAVRQWPTDGVPDNPYGWLVTVGARRYTDQLRSDTARERRETDPRALPPPDRQHEPAADLDDTDSTADTLALMFMCCHPALGREAQIALTLRAVGGLTTRETARAFFVPEATMTRRISRAKLRLAGVRLGDLTGLDRGQRIDAVLHVLYLIFNEGYSTSTGAALQRPDLADEAIRLARQLQALLPDVAEVQALLALMLLTNARSAARADARGALVPLAEQDRSRWDRAQLQEGEALVSAALQRRPLGSYQLQAAIAAVHAEAERAEATDWRQILAIYDLLVQIAPNPMTELSRAVAIAEVHGPDAGLAELDRLAVGGSLADNHRLTAVRAHLVERQGQADAARHLYETAARQSTSGPDQRYLQARAARLLDR